MRLRKGLSVLASDGVGTFAQRVFRYLSKRIPSSFSDLKYRLYRQQYQIDPSFCFNGPDISFYGNGEIILGSNSYIGRNSRIKSVAGQRVEIGENCPIGHYVAIYTQNRIADQDFRSGDREERTGDVIIGDNVWIGYFVFIIEGTQIREDSVIGAHSTVTRDIPPHCIAAGSPAEVVKFKSHLSERDRAALAQKYANVLSDDLRRQHLQ